MDGDEPLVKKEEEEEEGVGVAELLAGGTALMISWPFLEKLKSLLASGGMLPSYRREEEEHEGEEEDRFVTKTVVDIFDKV